jgi:non-specific serine/threonine protein kinase
MLAAKEGKYALARSHHDQALALRRQLGNTNGVAYSFWALATVALLEGSPATAESLFRESLAIFRDLGDRQGEAQALHGLARVSQRTGGELETLRRFHEALTLRQSLGERNWVVESIEGIAVVVAASGRVERAVRLLGAATTLRAAISLVPWVAERLEVEQTLALARRALSRSAFDESWRAGQRLTLEQATAEALELTQDSATVTAPVAPFNLTRRERDVLALLCQRLTDPEIAAQLFISPRTASSHVANVLGKLGMANRRDAAEFARSHGLV